MSSSFQSTAATNIYDSPVDTFVQPVRVLPKTGIMDLAETLASVNENLRPFLNQSITKGVEKEKRKATKDRIFAEINGGEVAKLSNDIRKKDGDDAARKIIGGSRVYRQQYEKAGVQLEALKFKGNFENAYDAARIDTGKVDGNGQPIFKFLREFSSDSDEFKNWRQSYLNKSIQTFTDEGIDPDIVDEFFIPTIQEELFNITNYATEKNQAFNFTKLQNKVPEVLDSAASFFVQGKDEEGGKVIAGFLQDFYNAGITGEDANKMYKQIVAGAFDKARLLVDPSKEKSFQLAEDFAEKKKILLELQKVEGVQRDELGRKLMDELQKKKDIRNEAKLELDILALRANGQNDIADKLQFQLDLKKQIKDVAEKLKITGKIH